MPDHTLLSGSGLVFYGGLAGGFVAVSVAIRRYQVPCWSSSTASLPAGPLNPAIGRIGCELAGDGDWGTPKLCRGRTPIRMRSSAGSAWVASNGLPADVRVHPTPIYDADVLSPSSASSGRCENDPWRRQPALAVLHPRRRSALRRRAHPRQPVLRRSHLSAVVRSDSSLSVSGAWPGANARRRRGARPAGPGEVWGRWLAPFVAPHPARGRSGISTPRTVCAGRFRRRTSPGRHPGTAVRLRPAAGSSSNLWATWCEPAAARCRDECLPELRASRVRDARRQ